MSQNTESKLEQLRKITTIVIDTGDIDAVKTYHPQDATTNPSLIYAASQKTQYQPLIDNAIERAKKSGGTLDAKKEKMMDILFVNFGTEILKHIPGRVSTEVDARLSFNIAGSIEKAHSLIKLYEEAGIAKERILIKLASTWEGVQAAKALEKENIHCNLTLMFSLAQAAACAEAKATLISPFVGRILDWHKERRGIASFAPSEDPGVISVRQIYYYLKKHGYKTQVMGASFRNIDEILELAGCDLLTIAPQLLEELNKQTGTLDRKLDPKKADELGAAKIGTDENSFRYLLNEDPMATEKLAEGIRKFAADSIKLEQHLQSRLA